MYAINHIVCSRVMHRRSVIIDLLVVLRCTCLKQCSAETNGIQHHIVTCLDSTLHGPGSTTVGRHVTLYSSADTRGGGVGGGGRPSASMSPVAMRKLHVTSRCRLQGT